MKRILLVIFCFTSVLTFAQKMNNGVYRNIKKDRSFESDIFEFKENNKFNYVLITCTGTGIGIGTYELRNDSIHLQFADMPNKSEKQIEVNFKKSESDSLKIDLKVLAFEDDSKLPMANCYFKDEKTSWETNLNGNVKASVLKKDTSRLLVISFFGFEDVEIQIPENATSLFGIVRLGNFGFYNSTEKQSFKIISNHYRHFTLARYEGKNISYEKVSRNKMQKVVKDRIGKELDYFIQE